MHDFDWEVARDLPDAVRRLAARGDAALIAGGTNMLDLMKENVSRPGQLIHIGRLPLAGIDATPDGGLRIGALASNADTASHPRVRADYPLLASAILAGASAQLRNMASAGGNLMQRTRCYYFYDVGTPCNKREPGSGCPAIGGMNRIHAILGASAHCVAVHPSDMCVALAALDATVEVLGPNGPRAIPFGQFHRLPGDTPERDTNLARDEIITALLLPPAGAARRSAYVKVRERSSYAFALVSAGVALELKDGVLGEVRIALGGVAHKPWRDAAAEQLLRGRSPDREAFRDAAQRLLRGAAGLSDNTYKIEMAARAVVRALEQATAAKEAP
ncbi:MULTISPECIES: FAD binding domain-containing protein [unclassified Janthinobacterium]|uniref:FAD binding domain-containing protein n=1 Tax=unclassified Janthinobacterium TaxID=2610881 RepID=UPI00034C5DB0|nr:MULTISPECIES: xanthine dehydrogenase family protein subunit M [unclassified Janthinobacterium]MEC5159844.1 xanthine dehydrogenase YagS FAD-binding subunit [Janthinobacterium sp. CG_S6]